MDNANDTERLIIKMHRELMPLRREYDESKAEMEDLERRLVGVCDRWNVASGKLREARGRFFDSLGKLPDDPLLGIVEG